MDTSLLKVSKYVVTSEFYDQNDGIQKVILFSTRSTQSRVIDTSTWAKIQEHCFDEVSDLKIFDLKKIKILVPSEEDELQTVIRENHENVQASDTLYIALQPTSGCQLGCGYCGQKHSSHKYKLFDEDRILERISKKLAAAPSKKKLKISWFGGEPLMASNVIKSLSGKFIKLCRERGIHYSAHLTTNGVLLNPELASDLANQYQVSSMEVTLDGPEHVHDARRHTKAKGKSFQTIYSNLLGIAGLQIFPAKVNIRCNADKNNISHVSSLIQQLSDDGILKKFKFYVASVHGWGNDAAKLAEEKQVFANHQIGWFLEMIEMGYDLQLLPKRKYDLCLATNPDAELIDPFGQIFNCTEVSLVPSYEKDGQNKYKLGHINDSIDYDKSLRKPLGDFEKQIKEGKVYCGNCPIFPVCGGSCPKEWIDGNIPCPPIKYNLNQILLLTYLRNKDRTSVSIEDTFPKFAEVTGLL